jgi:hypothetical protein
MFGQCQLHKMHQHNLSLWLFMPLSLPRHFLWQQLQCLRFLRIPLLQLHKLNTVYLLRNQLLHQLHLRNRSQLPSGHLRQRQLLSLLTLHLPMLNLLQLQHQLHLLHRRKGLLHQPVPRLMPSNLLQLLNHLQILCHPMRQLHQLIDLYLLLH